MQKYSFADLDTLLIRLLTAKKQGKKITILAGSGLTQPNLEKLELGVSSVAEIIDDIKDYFTNNGSPEIFDRYVDKTSSLPEQYQSAMVALLSSFGQDELNNVIIKAVLNAFKNKFVISENLEIKLDELEKEFNNWYLRDGVDSLGEMFVDFNEFFAGPILTSNFDPLLEISIRKHNGLPQSIFLVNDGKFLNHKSEKIHSVVHFHGYWHGSDTLHTLEQLKRERSQLKGDLKKLLDNSILLVVGYGGWNDVFTNTLLEIINEGNNNFDVLWCFYENNPQIIELKYDHSLQGMSKSIGQRVVLYKDIDCHKLFPKLLFKLNSSDPHSNAKVAEHYNDLVSGEKNSNQTAFPCDVPPNNLYWVGRQNELSLLNQLNFQTCFITGFGGQGKSGLASHFVKQLNQTISKVEMWDWRDCKEEDNKFQTILISQIERLSKGEYRASKISNERIEDLLNLFFEIIEDRKILFIYDNVDKYIDLEEFKPIGGLGQLFNISNNKNHRSHFIFTCRPHVKSDAINYLEIALKPLSLDDTINLLKSYSPPFNETNINEVAKKSHNLSNGHALWLTLIAAQSKRGLDLINQFLDDYSNSKMDYNNNPAFNLAQSTLDVVWKSLNLKQQTLLRGMAEMVTSLDKDELEIIFKPEISYNQFNKAFNFLNSLNLLVIKSQFGNKDLYELHPLVKEYVIHKYKHNERSKYITLIVNFYNQTIIWIKPKLNIDAPITYFEKYTQKAELQVNQLDFKGALISLYEISNQILAAGFSEEYVRVLNQLFDKIDWLKGVTEEYQYFHQQLHIFVQMLIEKGKNLEVLKNLDQYKNVIRGKSIDYINYCNLKSYYFWFTGDFKQAIEWSERGMELQKSSDIGLEINLKERYALALRDSKIDNNIQIALNLFLQGEKLDSILSSEFILDNFTSTFFGNIGRCLWYQHKYKEAIICYYKSYELLNNEKNSNTILNKGYACLWITEYLISLDEFASSLYFIKYCLNCWEKEAPIKALKVRTDYNYLINDSKNSEGFATLTQWDVEKYCNKFVKSNLSGPI